MKIFIANSTHYNHKKSFEDNGFIDWTQGRKKLNAGEFVLIKSTTENRIIFIAKVEEINMDYSRVLDDKNYWNQSYYSQYESYKKGKYCRLKLISVVESTLLTEFELGKLGIRAEDKEITNPQVIKHIKSLIASSDVIVKEEVEYLEGRLNEYKLTTHERNRVARQKCLDHYGYSCQVCELNFKDKYGLIGQDFIEVHHTTPISHQTEQYIIDPIKDLIPVCPNCHAMLHKKGIKEIFTVEELRKMLK